MAKVLQKSDPNFTTQKFILSFGINKKDQTPQPINQGEMRENVHAFNRQLKILDYFQYNTTTQWQVQFIHKSNWEPEPEHVSLLITQLTYRNNQITNRLLYSHSKQSDNKTSVVFSSYHTFDLRFYLQVQGTAMGKKFAPAYVNIYMAEWGETLF